MLAAVLFDYIGRRSAPKVAAVLRATYYLPQILPVAVAGVVWNWILNAQDGALNVILRRPRRRRPARLAGQPAAGACRA